MSSPAQAIERTWYAVAPNSGGEGPITFRVGLPQREPGGEWGVEISLGGIEPNPGKIFGEDGWQAVALGMRFIAARVADFSQRGWRFLGRGTASLRARRICMAAEMRSNKSFDTDTQRHCAARRAGERTTCGALPLCAAHLQR